MWAIEPPTAATDATPNGPPDIPSPSWLLLIRPREFADPTTAGVGPFLSRAFASEGDRVAFVTHWQHDL
jgi:hypothetical protein